MFSFLLDFLFKKKKSHFISIISVSIYIKQIICICCAKLFAMGRVCLNKTVLYFMNNVMCQHMKMYLSEAHSLMSPFLRPDYNLDTFYWLWVYPFHHFIL